MSRVLDNLEIEKVKKHWGSGNAAGWRTPKWVHWTEHPVVQKRLHGFKSGDSSKDHFQYFIDTYFKGIFRQRKRVNRVLTLGCGHGELERGLTKYDFAKVLEGIDIADGAIANAANQAKAAGF